jgi:hypothetical protein
MDLKLQFKKEAYIKKKYQKIANQILELIDTPEKLQNEVKLSCFGLWRIYHHLDLELDHIKTILETENGTKERSRRPRCDSCEDVRPTSPTF